MSIKVTVLMSVFNSEQYLREAIDSILNQTFKDFEFLIINDGSTDSSKEIVLSYNDPCIHLIDNEKNIGLTKSLNKGLKIAKGEYIARQDADDISLPGRFEKQVKYLNDHPEVALVGCEYEIIDRTCKKNSSTSNYVLSSEEIYYTLTFYNCIAHSSVMFRKRIVLEIGGYDETLIRSQDVDLWYKISRNSKIDVLNEILIKWRNIDTNISNLYRDQQDDYAKKIFIRNITDLMGNQVNIEKILCFHAEGFPERYPLNISLESLLELEKIQSKIIENCPTWLNREVLEDYADHKLVNYIYLLVRRGKLLTCLRLLAFSRVRKRFYGFLRRKLRI